jgi:hypothetical protein
MTEWLHDILLAGGPILGVFAGGVVNPRLKQSTMASRPLSRSLR